MFQIHETQYGVHNIHYWTVWYPRCTIILCLHGICDLQYLGLVSVIHIVCVWYPWYVISVRYPWKTIVMSGSRVRFYAMWISSHRILPNLISGEMDTINARSTCRSYVTKCVTIRATCVLSCLVSCMTVSCLVSCMTGLVSCPAWLVFMPNFIAVGQNMRHPCGNTQIDRDPHEPNKIFW